MSEQNPIVETTDSKAPARERRGSAPMWVVGTKRPPDRERRKNPGEWHRHEEARTGVAPDGCVEQRQPTAKASKPVLAPLWGDKK